MLDKFLKFFILLFLIASLSVVAFNYSYAATGKIGSVPGTDQSILEIQARRAQGKQLGDKAFRAEIIRKPESVTDLVCLPKLNGNFAGIATLFSDVKDQFTFDFSLNSLCQMAFSVNTGLGQELSGLLKVAATGALGLNLPSIDLCTNSLSLGIGLGGSLGGGFSSASAISLEFLGCAIQPSISISGGFSLAGSGSAGFSIPSYCVGLSIPAFECQGIGQFTKGVVAFAKEVGAKAGIDTSGMDETLMGKILPLSGGGFNGGVMFATEDEEISLLGGGGFDLANALGVDDINKSLSFMTEVSLSLDATFSAGVSSTDGLSSDGGVNVDAGAAVMAGTGDKFWGAYAGTDNAQKALQGMQNSMSNFSGAGSPGSLIWNPFPTIGADASGEAVIDLMLLASGGSSPTTP